MALVINLINGNIRMLLDTDDTIAKDLASRFPIGEVYIRMQELHGLQWRVLQRGTCVDDKLSYFDMILPVSIELLPEKVQLVHMCTE